MTISKETLNGSIAAALTYVIFGVNIVLCKDLLNCGIASPSVLFNIRAGGATLLMWILGCFRPKDKVDRKDLLKILGASLLGITVPHLSTLWGLKFSTPFDTSMVNSLKPLFAIFAGFIILREKVSLKTSAGVALGLAGAILLVLAGANLDDAFKTTPAGMLILALNGLSFAFYLVIFRPLIKKYSCLSFMKWCMLFAFICSIPIAAPDYGEVNLELFNAVRCLELLYLIIFGTFITYFISPYAQKRITPTQYCIISYVQPITATILSIAAGLDLFTWGKLAATILMISGVWITVTGKQNPSDDGQIQN